MNKKPREGPGLLAELPPRAQARRNALAQRALVLREIAQLRAEAEKEKQPNRRVEINLNIKSLEHRLAALLQWL